MGDAEQGFLITYEFGDDNRVLIIEDDGRVCHARVTWPKGKIASKVWLYNRVTGLEEAIPQGPGKFDLPINPRTYAFHWGEEPFPSSNADFRALISKSAGWRAMFTILIREQRFATLTIPHPIGRSKLAKKDGPLALRLVRPGEIYWRVVDPHWERTDIYNGADIFLHSFSQAPEPAGHLLAAHWCQSEVCNGGFHQFFTNSTGVLAPEAAQGFRAIGLPVVGEIVASAMAKFGASYPRERERRHEFLKKIPGKTRAEWDPFTALDEAFFTATSGDVFHEAADQYAARIMPLQAQRELMPESHVEGRACFERSGGSRSSQG